VACRSLGAAMARPVPTITYPSELPITAWREELLAVLRDHQVVVVAGETGSGKSTQLPKMLLEIGRGSERLVGHTQPRRIAARSIAERLAAELGTSIGGRVGYAVRFTDAVGPETMVKVMTDGILLNEIHRDRLLRRYDTIIIDEAHERSLNIDFLLGYLKRLLPRRPDLKVVITSATIDTARFAAHFDDAPIVEVSGRTHPVEIRYRPLDDPGGDVRDQPTAIADAVRELAGLGTGDILVFCSGEREIRDAVESIEELDLRHTEVLPLYGRLSAAQQHRVFATHTGRRIVVATNVAETSLTVPGIRSVVDAGTARISRYNRRTKVQRLPIEPISKASADQRAGRCGRLGPGVCIRLYSEDDYEARPEFTEPEILRTNLASVILQMAAIGLGDVGDFPFLDPPDTKSIRDGVALLVELGAVDPDQEGSERWLKPLGAKLARIPLDPRLARMLLAADEEACLREVLVIASGLSIVDPRERPDDAQTQADQAHARFRREGSDLLAWLELWRHLRSRRRRLTSSAFRRLCRDEYLNHRRVREWEDIHAQLRRVARDLGLVRNDEPADDGSIHRALLAGLLSHIGHKDPDSHEYRGARGARFAINPGSALFKLNPEWVMAAELVETKRLWAREVARIEPADVERVGAHLVKRTTSDPWWDAERGSVVANQTVTIFGLALAEGRTVQYGNVDPEGARRLFIQHALVAGEWDPPHAFWKRNQAAIDEVLAMEARTRRTDLLVPDRVIEAWYDARIPPDVVSARHFDRWWRGVVDETPHLLDLSVEDLVHPDAGDIDEERFPHFWHHGDLVFPIEYTFDPTSDVDGVVIEVPADSLHRIDADAFSWNVPGFRGELIEALLRTLPKTIRRELVPIPDTAVHIAESIHPSDGPILQVLQREVTQLTGQPVAFDVFDTAAVPSHLLPTLRLMGADGEVLAESTDVEVLRNVVSAETSDAVASVSHPIERTGLTTWDFEELPRRIRIPGERGDVVAHPALVDEGTDVAIRLLPGEADQAEEMWAGTRRLLLLCMPSPDRLLASVAGTELSLALVGSPYRDLTEWGGDALDAALDAAMTEAGGPAWCREDFSRLEMHVRGATADHLDQIAVRSIEIFRALAEVDELIEALDGSRHATAVADVDAQVDRLVYPGFISGVGVERLGDIERYLRAAVWRLQKLPEHPERDAASMAVVRGLEGRLDEVLDALGPLPALLDLAWSLQELRVSLFAQVVGVDGPVSAKRIAAALDDVILGR
jgi:ATP-dependent helicase HrpA